jgi:hypothetical protein
MAALLERFAQVGQFHDIQLQEQLYLRYFEFLLLAILDYNFYYLNLCLNILILEVQLLVSFRAYD